MVCSTPVGSGVRSSAALRRARDDRTRTQARLDGASALICVGAAVTVIQPATQSHQHGTSVSKDHEHIKTPLSLWPNPPSPHAEKYVVISATPMNRKSVKAFLDDSVLREK